MCVWIDISRAVNFRTPQWIFFLSFYLSLPYPSLFQPLLSSSSRRLFVCKQRRGTNVRIYLSNIYSSTFYSYLSIFLFLWWCLTVLMDFPYLACLFHYYRTRLTIINCLFWCNLIIKVINKSYFNSNIICFKFILFLLEVKFHTCFCFEINRIVYVPKDPSFQKESAWRWTLRHRCRYYSVRYCDHRCPIDCSYNRSHPLRL